MTYFLSEISRSFVTLLVCKAQLVTSVTTTQFNQYKTSCNKIHLSQIKYKSFGPNVVTIFLLLCMVGQLLANCQFCESLHYCSSLPHLIISFIIYKVALQLDFSLFGNRKH